MLNECQALREEVMTMKRGEEEARMLINVMDQDRRQNAREPKYNLCVCVRSIIASLTILCVLTQNDKMLVFVIHFGVLGTLLSELMSS